LIYAAEARLVQKARLVIFNSFSGYRLAQARGMALGASVVIPNGIDTNAFVRNETVRRDIRHSWRVADGESVVGMIGRFDPMKDHRTFAAAAETLLGRRPNLRFVLAGDGIVPENDRLSALLRDPELSRRVLLLGERADVPAIMAGIDVLCLSSAFGEGFSNVLGEAMASGAPCAATDVGDAKEIIGDTGEVVAPRDPVALAGGVDRLLGRLAQAPDAVRSAARERIVENFSVDRLVVRTEEVLGQSAAQALEAA
ncbi:MAG: glycosyltransferase, partial [Alphaproteobacteria bacterium]|nr:glycosyltransferase [Alphaproteobacteria bacterium]